MQRYDVYFRYVLDSSKTLSIGGKNCDNLPRLDELVPTWDISVLLDGCNYIESSL